MYVCIVNKFIYFPNRPFERVAAAMEMTENAVRLLVSRSTKSQSKTDLSASSSSNIATPIFDNFTVGAIRRHIHAMFIAKQLFTIDTLTEALKRSAIIPENTSEKAVWRILHSMGFQYKTSQRKMYVRKESIDVVCRRIDALRSLRQHRIEGRQMVYFKDVNLYSDI